MIEAPKILHAASQRMACIHLTVPREEMRHVMGPGLVEVKDVLVAQGIQPTGPWFTHHLRAPAATFDFEICIPVDRQIMPSGRVKSGQLPATTVARTIYNGPYEKLGQAWGEFSNWLKSNGYETRPDLWECYVAGPESSSDPMQWRTELNQPVVEK